MSWSTAISSPDSFGSSLSPDPAVALVSPVVAALKPGPAHHAQLVVELVGPRSATAASVEALLRPDWFSALGQPELYAMRPADKEWQTLGQGVGGSYDSIALCWDLLGASGSLSSASAQHLFQASEQFAASIGRRAMPLPPPADVDRAVRQLLSSQENLDVGISLMVLPRSGAVAERELWTVCARLGLEFSPGGSFDWRSAAHPSPLFSVTPIGAVDRFSLGAVQAGAIHEGVTIGFSVPRCPAPMAALDGALKAAGVISEAILGAVFDDEGKPLAARVQDDLRRMLMQGVQMLEQAGLKPGSAAALKVFE